MGNHHLKLFVVDGKLWIIHHDTGNPNDDNPGDPFSAKHGNKVRFKSQDSGSFSIEFKAKSPFISDAGKPNDPIYSTTASNGVDWTDFEILKPIQTLQEFFPYTVTIGGVPYDPQIIIDESGGGGTPVKKAKKKKRR